MKIFKVESPSFYRSNYDTENEMMTAILTNIEQILIERNDEIAGFILEPLIQGATGLFVHPKGF